MEVAVLRRNQVEDQQVRQRCSAKTVTQRKRFGSCRIEHPFHLKTRIANARCKDWVLTVALGGDTYVRTPEHACEKRIGIGHSHPLEKTRAKNTERDGLSLASKVSMRVLKGAARTPERFLTTPKSWRQAGGRDAGNRHCAARNAASAVDHFKAKSVTYLVLLRLVDLDDYIFLGLRRNLPSRIDLSPTENAKFE